MKEQAEAYEKIADKLVHIRLSDADRQMLGQVSKAVSSMRSDIFGPTRLFADMAREHERIRKQMVDLLRPHESALEAARKALMPVPSSVFALDTIAKTMASFRFPTSAIEEHFKMIAKQHEGFATKFAQSLCPPREWERMTAGLKVHGSVIDAIRAQAKTWKRAMESSSLRQTALSSLPRLQEASIAWDAGQSRLLAKMGEIGILSRSDRLSARLLSASAAFTGFAERTARLIESSMSAAHTMALNASLRLGETQLLASTELLSDVLVRPIDRRSISRPRALTLLDGQQSELIGSASLEANAPTDELVKSSDAAGIQERCRRLLSLVADCNGCAKILEKEEIFKPTTRLLEAFADLPWLLADSRKPFAEVVDCLYFIFYEGAGKDHLRYMKGEGGVLEDKDCDFVWCVKHLRNKWTRHDADHGKDAEIRKSWSQLREKFVWLGLGHPPVQPEDFRFLHRSLIQKAVEFVEAIRDRLGH